MKETFVAYGSENYTFGNVLDRNNKSTEYFCDKIKCIELTYFKKSDRFIYKPYLFKIFNLKFFKNRIIENNYDTLSLSKLYNYIKENYIHKYYIHCEDNNVVIIEYPTIKITFIDNTFIRFYFDGNSEADEFLYLLNMRIYNKELRFKIEEFIEYFRNSLAKKHQTYIEERETFIENLYKKNNIPDFIIG